MKQCSRRDRAGTTSHQRSTLHTDQPGHDLSSGLNVQDSRVLTGWRLPTHEEFADRFARFGAEYVEAALTAQGRRLLVVDPAEVDDDLVRDVTEILTSLCARLYGRRAAANRAQRAVAAATGPQQSA
jgi:predicted site-specific integrase-resolvase